MCISRSGFDGVGFEGVEKGGKKKKKEEVKRKKEKRRDNEKEHKFMSWVDSKKRLRRKVEGGFEIVEDVLYCIILDRMIDFLNLFCGFCRFSLSFHIFIFS